MSDPISEVVSMVLGESYIGSHTASILIEHVIHLALEIQFMAGSNLAAAIQRS